METLKEALLRLDPTFDLFLNCLGFGYLAEVKMTPDGCFLGRARGETDFDYRLGHQSIATTARAQALFRKLTTRHQKELVQELYARHIPPEALGLPSDNHKSCARELEK